MPATGLEAEKMLGDLLKAKDKHNFDAENFLLLLGMVNLMQIVNLLDGRVRGSQSKSTPGRRGTAGADLAPMMGMFGPQRNKSPGLK